MCSIGSGKQTSYAVWATRERFFRLCEARSTSNSDVTLINTLQLFVQPAEPTTYAYMNSAVYKPLGSARLVFKC